MQSKVRRFPRLSLPHPPKLNLFGNSRRLQSTHLGPVFLNFCLTYLQTGDGSTLLAGTVRQIGCGSATAYRISGKPPPPVSYQFAFSNFCQKLTRNMPAGANPINAARPRKTRYGNVVPVFFFSRRMTSRGHWRKCDAPQPTSIAGCSIRVSTHAQPSHVR